MSFVIAHRTDDLIFFIADTYQADQLTNAKRHWFTEPLVKVVKLRQNWVVAYAGNAEIARIAFSDLEKNQCSNVRDCLTKLHLQHFADQEKYVEFAVCEVSARSLVFIKDGCVQPTSSSYLGSKKAMELFQRERADRAVHSEGGHINVTQMIEGVSSSSNDRYSKSLNAFQRVLQQSNDLFGGFSVPFVVSEQRVGYIAYMEAIRGPVEQFETSATGWRTISLQDFQRGGYQLCFSASQTGFAAYFPFGSCGCTYPGFHACQNFSPQYYKDIDSHDFEHLAEKNNIPDLILSGRTIALDLQKIHKLITAKKFSRARLLLTSVKKKLLASIAEQTPDSQINLSGSILESLGSVTEALRKLYLQSIMLISSLKFTMQNTALQWRHTTWIANAISIRKRHHGNIWWIRLSLESRLNLQEGDDST